MRKTIIVTNNIISEIDMIPASKAICIQYVFSQGRANRIVTLACYVVSFAERVNCKVHPSKGLLLVLESKYEKRFRLKSFQTPFVSLVSLFETKVQKMTAATIYFQHHIQSIDYALLFTGVKVNVMCLVQCKNMYLLPLIPFLIKSFSYD